LRVGGNLLLLPLPDVNQLVVHPLDPHANEVANAKYVAFLAAHLRDDGVLPLPPDTSK
jgi:hypothetical protein